MQGPEDLGYIGGLRSVVLIMEGASMAVGCETSFIVANLITLLY
jgi:hypothetical protein